MGFDRSPRGLVHRAGEFSEQTLQILRGGGRRTLFREIRAEVKSLSEKFEKSLTEIAQKMAKAGEEGGAPPLAGLPDAPSVADNAALIRVMLAGEIAVPAPIRAQVAALASLAT